jgi:hypothetical protein
MTERSVLVLVLTKLPSVRFAPCAIGVVRCGLSVAATEIVDLAIVALAKSDPERGFAVACGVKPRAATASGGSGLTPHATAQAQSVSG